MTYLCKAFVTALSSEHVIYKHLKSPLLLIISAVSLFCSMRQSLVNLGIKTFPWHVFLSSQKLMFFRLDNHCGLTKNKIQHLFFS